MGATRSLTIDVQDGFFKKATKPRSELVTKTKVVGNGWIAEVRKDGTINCITEEITPEGKKSLKFSIYPNMQTRVSIKENDNPIKVIKRGFINSHTKKLNGKIYLFGGEFSQRYGFFRDADIRSFFKKHGIMQVIHKDPNDKYNIKDIEKSDFHWKEEVFTDGEITVSNIEQKEETIFKTVEVTNATWAAVKVNGKSGRLYTMCKDVVTLDIPE